MCVKNHSNVIVAVFLFFMHGTSMLYAQKDTLYFDSQWKPTTKDSANFYRPPVRKEGKLFRVKDYYIGGELQMNGLSKDAEKDIWQGKVTWYQKDGTILQQGTYENNRLQGEYVTFWKGKKLVSVYEDGYFKSGKRYVLSNRLKILTEKEGDTLKEVFFDQDIGGIRYVNYSISNGATFYTKYYDENGDYIGERGSTIDGRTKGLDVQYYYNPMRIQRIQYYGKGNLLGSTEYYSNGQVRKKFLQKPKFIEQFFRPDGTVLGEITYNFSRDYLRPYDGAQFTFFSLRDVDEQDKVKSIQLYKKGKLVSLANFYENGKLRSKENYVEGVKETRTSYDENGIEIARMTYKNYLPENGTEIIGDRRSVYKNGKLIIEEVFYPKTAILFSTKEATTETYFDKLGKVLGTLSFQQGSFNKPINGTRYFIDYKGNISRIEAFEDSKRTTETNFIYINEDKKVFREEVFYDADGYSKIKEVDYYSNGQKQSVVTFSGYDKQKGLYYDMKGNLMGTYDFIAEEGIFYEFFGASDAIREFKERADDTVLRNRIYVQTYFRDTNTTKPILVEDVDVDCCGTFYTDQGEILAKIIFKDQKPFEGQLYLRSTKELFTFKNGKRNGIYKKLDYSGRVLQEGQYLEDVKSGTFLTYTYKGVLMRKEQFSQGTLNGKATFYDAEGKEKFTMLYKQGKPVEGTRLLASYANYEPEEETFKDGQIVQRVTHGKNGKTVIGYINGIPAETTAYYADTNKERLRYSLTNNAIDGPVIRFDKEGKEAHSAKFSDGKLLEGTVLLTPGNARRGVAYIIVQQLSDKVKIQFMDEQDVPLFKAEEKLVLGSSLDFMKDLQIYLDNIGPDRLY